MAVGREYPAHAHARARALHTRATVQYSSTSSSEAHYVCSAGLCPFVPHIDRHTDRIWRNGRCSHRYAWFLVSLAY
eukprot:6492532-Amphidinium_carterae.1